MMSEKIGERAYEIRTQCREISSVCLQENSAREISVKHIMDPLFQQCLQRPLFPIVWIRYSGYKFGDPIGRLGGESGYVALLLRLLQSRHCIYSQAKMKNKKTYTSDFNVRCRRGINMTFPVNRFVSTQRKSKFALVPSLYICQCERHQVLGLSC